MKKSYLLIMAAAALVSCSKSEIITPDMDGDVQIAVGATTVDASGVVTRAPFEGAISATNQFVARVIADDVDVFSGTPITNGTMTFKGGLSTNFDDPLTTGASIFPDATNPVYLFGMYPSTWTYGNGGAANITFTGKEDVMATEKISTIKNDVVTSAYKKLEFKHLLTRLEVKLSATSTAQSALGALQSLKLIGDATTGTTPVNNTLAITNNGTAMTKAFSSVSATSLNFYGLSLDAESKKVYADAAVSAYTFTDTPTFVGYSMVAPVTATASGSTEYFLEIATSTLGVKRVAVNLTSATNTEFTGSTEGRAFIVAINFKDNAEIAVDVTVTDWVEEGEWAGEVPVN